MLTNKKQQQQHIILAFSVLSYYKHWNIKTTADSTGLAIIFGYCQY